MPRSSNKKPWLPLSMLFALAMTARADVVAHWSFDELSGPDHDTYVDTGGAPTKHNALVADKGQVAINVGSNTPFGKAVTFNGKPGSYLDVPPLTELHNHSFTIAVWVYLDANEHNFVLADWGTPNKLAFAFGLDTGRGSTASRLTAFMRNNDFKVNKKTKVSTNADIVKFQPTTPVPLSSWHHVAWVWDRSNETAPTLTGYLDGVKLASSNLAKGVTKIDLLDNRSPIKIGLKQDTLNTFHGSMDELWVFSNALTPDQITNLMRSNDIAGGNQVASAIPSTPIAPVTPQTPAAAPTTPAPSPTPPSTPASPTAATPETPAPSVSSATPTTPAAIAAGTPTTPTPTPTSPTVAADTPKTEYVPTPSVVAPTVKPFVPLAPPTVAVASSHYTPERMLGIAGSGTLALTLSGFLVWATKERSRMRHSHR